MNDKVQENIAYLEGQVVGQRLVLAAVIHVALTGAPFTPAHETIRAEYQSLAEATPSLYPEHKETFLSGVRNGINYTVGMAKSLESTIAQREQSNSDDA